MYTTGLHLLSLHLIDRTPPVAKLEASALTLNSLSKSSATNNSLVVKVPFNCLNAFCWASSHLHFTSFLVSMFKGLTSTAKFLIKCL